MKKIFITCGIAIAAIGFYTGAFAENNTRIHEDFSINFQDTIPGKKRDTTNRRPMPTDTIKKDSLKTNLLNVAVK